jgi:uncharacterized protein
MPPEFAVTSNQEAIIRSYPVVTYFALTFSISWMAALAVAAPHLIRHQPLPQMTGILMFPVMLLGPSLAGIVLTRIVDGKSGLRVLFCQMFRAWVPPRWYTALLLPPALVLTSVGVVESPFHVLHFVWGSGGGYGAILREMRRAPRKRSKRDVPG